MKPEPVPSFVVRPIDPGSRSEIELVAERMRLTLIEVLGEERGASMYPMDWLIQRVELHLDAARCTGAVFVADVAGGAIAGHTIVRIEEELGLRFGLFSTTYVDPPARRSGVAAELLRRGERWMQDQRVPVARTYTSETNSGLIKLYEGFGYAITQRHPDKQMIVLERALPAA